MQYAVLSTGTVNYKISMIIHLPYLFIRFSFSAELRKFKRCQALLEFENKIFLASLNLFLYKSKIFFALSIFIESRFFNETIQ